MHTCHRPPRTSAADLGRSIADASPAGSRALADSDTGVPYCLMSTPAPRPARHGELVCITRERTTPSNPNAGIKPELRDFLVHGQETQGHSSDEKRREHGRRRRASAGLRR